MTDVMRDHAAAASATCVSTKSQAGGAVELGVV